MSCKVKLIWRILPKYGNWGGLGWSAGVYHGTRDSVDWAVPAICSMDELFKSHDKERKDSVLVAGLKALPRKCKQWNKVPPKRFKARWYRPLATFIFWFLIRIGKSKG